MHEALARSRQGRRLAGAALTIAVFLGVALAADPAGAALIDFSSWGAADGQQSFERDGIRVSTRAGATLRVTADGLGVDCHARCVRGEDPTVVGRGELLVLRLSDPVPIESFSVAQMGRFELGLVQGQDFRRRFVGSGSGERVVALDRSSSYLAFSALWLGDYSLRSVSLQRPLANPEPAAGVLFAAGALLVGWAIRRT